MSPQGAQSVVHAPLNPFVKWLGLVNKFSSSVTLHHHRDRETKQVDTQNHKMIMISRSGKYGPQEPGGRPVEPRIGLVRNCRKWWLIIRRWKREVGEADEGRRHQHPAADQRCHRASPGPNVTKDMKILSKWRIIRWTERVRRREKQGICIQQGSIGSEQWSRCCGMPRGDRGCAVGDGWRPAWYVTPLPDTPDL